ncbi:MAG: hypothetical protein KDC92_10255 [Bacteroidetes bacterium]|nr:hypothetical protein [Bacteroidota bacterium]
MPQKLQLQQENADLGYKVYFGIATTSADYKLNYFLQKITNQQPIDCLGITSSNKLFKKWLFTLIQSQIVLLENKKDGVALISKLKQADYVLCCKGNEALATYNLLKTELLNANFIQSIFAVNDSVLTQKNKQYFDTTHL